MQNSAEFFKLPSQHRKDVANHEAGHAVVALAASVIDEYESFVKSWAIGVFKKGVTKKDFLRDRDYRAVCDHPTYAGIIDVPRPGTPPRIDLAFLLAGDAAEGRTSLKLSYEKIFEGKHNPEIDFDSAYTILTEHWGINDKLFPSVQNALQNCFWKVWGLFKDHHLFKRARDSVGRYMLSEVMRRHGKVHQDLLDVLSDDGIKRKELSQMLRAIERLKLYSTARSSMNRKKAG